MHGRHPWYSGVASVSRTRRGTTGTQWAGEQHRVRGGRRDSLRNCRTLRRRGQGPSAQEGRRAGVLVPELPAAQRREPRPTRSGSPARLRSFCQQDPPPGLVAYLDSPGTPSWDRAGQLLVGGAVALVAVRRGRWAAVPLAVVVARLLLDPATYPYYTAGLLLACAAVDLLTPRRQLPLWTAAAAGLYLLDQIGTEALSAGTLGAVRALYCLVVLAMLVLPGQQASGLPSQPLALPAS